jgi:hypothetical protein
MLQNQRTILTSEINLLMETIREQADTFTSCEDKIPILEFDILKDNIRKLYEKLCLLERLNDPFEIIKPKEQEVIEDQLQPTQTEPVSEIAELPVPEETVQNPEEKEEPPKTNEETVKLDLFTSEKSAFNDKLKEAREQSLGPRGGPSAPADIKSLININDKFLFINELFDGDYKEYSHAIEIFNNFEEKGEAFEFLESLLKDNLWNSASPAFQKLKEIVEKRFS